MSDCEAVNDRLHFARRRLRELEELNDGDLAGANSKDRQQLIQELFFHLVGSIDFLAQCINVSQNLGIHAEEVYIKNVCSKLERANQIKRLLKQLYPRTRRMPLPPDPYSDKGCHFRIIVFRNRVCHHRDNPFFFRAGSELQCSLFVDPRDTSIGGSKKPALDELNHFWELVNDKCQRVLALL